MRTGSFVVSHSDSLVHAFLSQITCQLHESESSTLPSRNTATYAQTKCSTSLRSRFYDVLILYSSYTNNNVVKRVFFYYHVLYNFFSVSLKCVENVPVKLLLLKKVLCSLSRSPVQNGEMSPPCGTFTMQPQAEWTFDQYSSMVLINSVYTSVGFVHFNYCNPYRILWVLPAICERKNEGTRQRVSLLNNDSFTSPVEIKSTPALEEPFWTPSPLWSSWSLNDGALNPGNTDPA